MKDDIKEEACNFFYIDSILENRFSFMGKYRHFVKIMMSAVMMHSLNILALLYC